MVTFLGHRPLEIKCCKEALNYVIYKGSTLLKWIAKLSVEKNNDVFEKWDKSIIDSTKRRKLHGFHCAFITELRQDIPKL